MKRFALLLAVSALASGCFSNKLRIQSNFESPIMSWEDWGPPEKITKLAFHLNDANCKLTNAYGEKVSDDLWLIEAVDPNVGFSGPVTYGRVPEGAKETLPKQGDLTEDCMYAVRIWRMKNPAKPHEGVEDLWNYFTY